VRTETAIAQGTTSLAHAAVALAADQLEGGLEGRSCWSSGQERWSGFCRALAQPTALARVVIANRPPAGSRDRGAIGRRGGEPLEVDDELGRADIVLTSTAAADVVLDVARIGRMMRSRPTGPCWWSTSLFHET